MEKDLKYSEVDIFDKMKQMDGASMVELPPKCHAYLEGKFVDYVDGESIAMTFPLYEKYNNPVGILLGGFLPLFFDATMGPFSYLIAKKPATSLDLNTTFLRPVTTADKELKVTVSIISKSKSYLFLEGKAWNAKNKLVATATSRMKIMEVPGMK